MDYPQKHRPYNLIMSSSPDKDPEPRGLSIILTRAKHHPDPNQQTRQTQGRRLCQLETPET